MKYCFGTDLFDIKRIQKIKEGHRCSSRSNIWDWVVLCYLSLMLALCKFGKIVIWELWQENRARTYWVEKLVEGTNLYIKCLTHEHPMFKDVVIMRTFYVQKERKNLLQCCLACNVSSIVSTTKLYFLSRATLVALDFFNNLRSYHFVSRLSA